MAGDTRTHTRPFLGQQSVGVIEPPDDVASSASDPPDLAKHLAHSRQQLRVAGDVLQAVEGPLLVLELETYVHQDCANYLTRSVIPERLRRTFSHHQSLGHGS